MNTIKDHIRGIDTAVPRQHAPAQGSRADALSMAQAGTLTMDKVGRFLDGIVRPQGNALASEMIDENGPLAGREAARGKRRSGSVALQFSEEDRPLLFAPNDAPDELPQQPTELDRLLRQQECRERRRFIA